MNIKELLNKKVVLFDGAMGTMIQNLNVEIGEIPELLNFTNPDAIQGIHESYLKAGSDFVSANTFGANQYKLENSGYTVEAVIDSAISIAQKAARPFGKYVALDLGPVGKLMAPIGELTFEEAYDSYKQQVIAGEAAGADAVIFETFTDIYEMKVAVLAAKENSNLPIFCSVTFQEDGRMLTGTDPITMVNILQNLGIDALGVNCSLGPKQMLPIIREILKYSEIPVIVQPNAGLPRIEEGETVFDVTIDEYIETCKILAEEGVRILGGCCGTNPDYIKGIAEKLEGKAPVIKAVPKLTAVSSSTKTVVIGDRIRIIGERINPTGKKKLKEALNNKDFSYIEDEAFRQVAEGAEILDINVGLPGIDEKEMMLKAIEKVSGITDAPLQIDSADPAVIEAAARQYCGRPLINSVNGKKESMDKIFPIAAKYGACLIALALDESGIPETCEQRVEIIGRILKEAAKYGIAKERIIADCLTMTVSAQQTAARETLKAVRMVKEIYGINTALGASNISFGLPERKVINRTFLAAALEAGLDAPITDPLEPSYIETIRAYEVLSCKDIDSSDYIAYCEKRKDNQLPGENSQLQNATNITENLSDIILRGFQDKAAGATAKLLHEGAAPASIISDIIVPALSEVGLQFEKGNLYLPQLIKAADTVKKAFEVIKRELDKSGEKVERGKIVVATVKGDVHDIGKNIAKVMLENNGYDVIDLGKDVDIALVRDTVKRKNIKLLGLSALMTTTVVSMEETIKEVRLHCPECKIMVGGAVLTEEYAKKIGADYYCKDALVGVRVADKVFSML